MTGDGLPKSWNSIPAEVLYFIYSILKDVDYKGLLQCQYVCQAWREPAQRAACRKIQLTTYTQLVALVRTLQERRELGKVIRQINFNKVFQPKEGGPWDPQDCFTEIDKYCPNVKTLITSHSCPSLWLRLSLDRQDKWRHLKRIPQTFDADGIELYIAAAIALRDRLTDLCLFDCVNSHDANPTDGNFFFEELAECLGEFQQLNQLEIRKYNTSQLCHFDKYLDQCPKLTKLQVHLFPTIEELDVNGRSILNNTLLSTFPSRETMDFIKKAKPKDHIKELSGCVPLREDEHLSYIMQAFPSLTSMNLNLEPEPTSLAVTRVLHAASTPSLMSDFLCYLLNIPKYKVNYLYTNDVKAALSQYWNSQVYKEKRGSNHVSLGISYNWIQPTENVPFIEGYKIPSIFVSHHHKVEVVFPANEGVEFAHKELIETTGSLLTHLAINTSVRSNIFVGLQDELNMLQGHYLDHIFKHCHSLKHLTWSQQKLLYCNPEASINHSIETLTIDHAHINAEILSQLSVRLPSLKKLSLHNYNFIKFDGNIVKNRHTTIDMPYTNFDYLYLQEYVDTKKKESVSYKYLYIKYTCPSGDECRAVIPQQDDPNNKRFVRSTVDQYSKAMSNKEAYTVQIKCKSIKQLRVCGGDFNRTLNLL